MTSTSQVRASGERTDEAVVPPGRALRGLRGLPLAALLAASVAIVCAVLLPLLPVRVSTPVVEWPGGPGVPRSTALQLVTQRPLGLSVRFDDAAVRAASTTSDGLIFATMPAAADPSNELGLTARARADRLTVTTRGVVLFDAVLPPGPSAVAVDGDLDAVRLTVDGVVAGEAPGRELPDVDALVTSLPQASPGAPAPVLSARLLVDDQASTSPTAVKIVVTVLLVLAVLATLVVLGVADRRRRGALTATTTTTRGPPPRPSVVDAVVVATMLVWLLLAPMTDDDGYYGAMAANVPANGYVANYYQLYNQSFTPFTWIYYALSWWQSIAGGSPVVLRIPALAAGLATWALVRAFVGRTWPDADRPRLRAIARAVLGLCFLAWWLPYDMGVRPEAVVALSAVASLFLLTIATERGSRAPAALAVAVAAFGVTAAPTGFVALAPLLAGAPAVWRILGREEGRSGSLLALVPVVAPGALLGVLAFADGSLRDFTRAQQIFLGMQEQETWYTEIRRWNFLLTDGAMGNYAKRAPVLFGVLAVVVFLVLVGHASSRRLLPPRLALVGWTTLAGFALLWLTPSKWTHHFGTLAGVGAVLLAMVVVSVPSVARARSGSGRSLLPPTIGGAIVVAVVAALAGHGSQRWPYSWLLGLPDPESQPQVSFLRLDQPLWYLLAVAVLAAVGAGFARRRHPAWRPAAGLVAVPVVVCLFLLASTTYLLGGFALGALSTASTWSPWADAVRDPLGHRCVAASQTEVLDPSTAVGLPPVLPAPSPPGAAAFLRDAWFPTAPPPAGLAQRTEIWGSFGGPSALGDGADGAVGAFSTPWYRVPPPASGQVMSTAVTGRTGEGNVLRVEYARPGPTGPVRVGGADLGLAPDGSAVDSTTWRSVPLDRGAGPPPDATMVRLVAVDSSTARGGWLAFSTPSVQRWRGLADLVPPGGPAAVGWQIAFLFPCQRKPVQAQGVNEPAPVALAWGDEPLSGLGDGIFQPGRGGHFAQSLRDGPVAELPVRLRDFPDVDSLQFYLLTSPVAPGDAYRLVPGSTVTSGFAPAPNTTFSTPVVPASSSG